MIVGRVVTWVVAWLGVGEVGVVEDRGLRMVDHAQEVGLGRQRPGLGVQKVGEVALGNVLTVG